VLILKVLALRRIRSNSCVHTEYFLPNDEVGCPILSPTWHIHYALTSR
jgi:hypothetical protein